MYLSQSVSSLSLITLLWSVLVNFCMWVCVLHSKVMQFPSGWLFFVTSITKLWDTKNVKLTISTEKYYSIRCQRPPAVYCPQPNYCFCKSRLKRSALSFHSSLLGTSHFTLSHTHTHIYIIRVFLRLDLQGWNRIRFLDECSVRVALRGHYFHRSVRLSV
jgi:hypothetical protein